ncbi:MAG: hypothetical protein CL992_03705 [Euryarchaeota archaeon]|nr:hypothetical protein [Euryarchaeota archaeon]
MRGVLLTLLLLSFAAVSTFAEEDRTFTSVGHDVSIVHDESSRTIIASVGSGSFKITYGSSMDSDSITMTSMVPLFNGHVIHVDVQGHLDAHNHLSEKHVVVHRFDGAIEYLDADDDGLLGVNASLAHKSRLDTETLTEEVVALADYSTLDWSAEIHSDVLDDQSVVATVRLTSVDVPLRDINGSLIKRIPLIEYRFIWVNSMIVEGERLHPVYRLEVDQASQVVNALPDGDVMTPAHIITSQWKYNQTIEGWNSTTSEGPNRLHISTQTLHAIESDEIAKAWMTYHGMAELPAKQPISLLLHAEHEPPETFGPHRSFECTNSTQELGCLAPGQMLNDIITPMKLQGSRVRFLPVRTGIGPSVAESSVLSDLHWTTNVTVDDVEYDVLSQVDDGRNATSEDLASLAFDSMGGSVFRIGLNYPLGQHSHHECEMITESIEYAAYAVDVGTDNSVGSVGVVVGLLMGLIFAAFVILAVVVARTSASTLHSSSRGRSSHDTEE